MSHVSQPRREVIGGFLPKHNHETYSKTSADLNYATLSFWGTLYFFPFRDQAHKIGIRTLGESNCVDLRDTRLGSLVEKGGERQH